MTTYSDWDQRQLDIESGEEMDRRAAGQSWKVEVQADSSGTWASSGIRLPTAVEADAYGLDLNMRWLFSVREYRVSASEEQPNYQFVNGYLQAIKR